MNEPSDTQVELQLDFQFEQKSIHMEKETPPLCPVILTKGERKNQCCMRKILVEGETLCKLHRALEDKKPYNPYVDKEASIEIADGIAKSVLGEFPLKGTPWQNLIM